MHENVSLGGPVLWFFVFLFGVAFLGALFQLVDVARRRDADYGRFTRIVWLPLPLFFVLGVLVAVIGAYAGWQPVLQVGYGSVLSLLTVANLIQLPAYLLRVVFPTPERAVARSEAIGEPAPEWACDALENDGVDSAGIEACEEPMQPLTEDAEAE